jgi:hypothetical protein
VRFVVALLVAASLAACGGVAKRDDALKVVFNDEGIVVEPPLAGVQRQWTRGEAIAAIKKVDFFTAATPRVWFGTYQGQSAWLAIESGLRVAPSHGRGGRGFHVGVFADGVRPAKALSGLAESGGEPAPVNVAPPRHAYTGRLHVTFVTPSGGAIGGSLAKWMMEPAPWAHSLQSVEDAKRRTGSTSANPGGKRQRVFFGLFTGLDDSGAMHHRTKAWMAIGYHVRLVAYGSHEPGPPKYGFGMAAFGDDLTQPWVSGQLTSAGVPPLVF